ncbi:MAG: Fic family protein [Balneolaceae bacterium]
MLFNWHQMLMSGRRDLQVIGGYRIHTEPMQVVSGPVDRPTVHFEAPPSEKIPEEMDRFIEWFNRTRPDGPQELPGLLRSGIAHLYFESIHPFEDGNGRIGRGISEKVLSQSLARPTLIAISTVIEANKKAYYMALHRASTGLEITGWLHYFCKTVLNAQDRTQSMIDFLIEKGKLYQAYAGQLNNRQDKVVERMFREGISGFYGGLSAKNYLSITGTTRATATRDLQSLVEMGAFTRTGKRKYMRYFLNIDHESVKHNGTEV